MIQVVKHIKRPFITRKINNGAAISTKTADNTDAVVEEAKEDDKKANSKKNKKEKKDNTMTEEQILALENAANAMEHKKVLKADRGLIERTESSKVILTEDNRQVLTD